MGFYRDYVLPPLTDFLMSNREFAKYRRRCVAMAKGRVLEIGIGSGLNLPHYGPKVSAVYGIDPSAGLLKRVAKQTAGKPLLVRGSAETIPFDREIFDTIVTTWTLCSIPDAHAALREMGRILHCDGRLLFVEHGLAPDRGIARWQNRLTPCWQRLGGGCHLNRKIDQLIATAGFHIEELETGYMRGRNPFAYIYEGVARFVD
jgi:ubiquinone/menaquinone biosynthesis C-methylase UbiE